MDKELAQQLSKKLKISTPQIVREEYELIILKELFSSSIGEKLVFKGGTALRLGYDSPRFSDDLDFSTIGKIKEDVFKKACQDIANSNQNLSLVEALEKAYTLFALFKISDPSLSQNFSIKIDISIRKIDLAEGKDYVPLLLKSSVSPINLIANTTTLQKVLSDKLDISPKRIRDIFDIWFVEQRFGNVSKKMDFSQFGKNEVRRELNRLLPISYKSLIDGLTKTNE